MFVVKFGGSVVRYTAQLSPIIVPIDGVLWEVIQCMSVLYECAVCGE